MVGGVLCFVTLTFLLFIVGVCVLRLGVWFWIWLFCVLSFWFVCFCWFGFRLFCGLDWVGCGFGSFDVVTVLWFMIYGWMFGFMVRLVVDCYFIVLVV